MKKLIFSLLMIGTLYTSSDAQTLRMVMGVAGGKNFTLGQTFVGYSKGNPNKLWQGFWVPRNVVSSLNEEKNNFVPSISKVYPNPATSFFNVESSEFIQTVQVYTQSGQLVHDGNVSQITLDNFIPSLYIVKVTHASGTINIHKLLVTR
jgi:hypothetical protein